MRHKKSLCFLDLLGNQSQSTKHQPDVSVGSSSAESLTSSWFAAKRVPSFTLDEYLLSNSTDEETSGYCLSDLKVESRRITWSRTKLDDIRALHGLTGLKKPIRKRSLRKHSTRRVAVPPRSGTKINRTSLLNTQISSSRNLYQGLMKVLKKPNQEVKEDLGFKLKLSKIVKTIKKHLSKDDPGCESDENWINNNFTTFPPQEKPEVRQEKSKERGHLSKRKRKRLVMRQKLNKKLSSTNKKPFPISTQKKKQTSKEPSLIENISWLRSPFPSSGAWEQKRSNFLPESDSETSLCVHNTKFFSTSKYSPKSSTVPKQRPILPLRYKSILKSAQQPAEAEKQASIFSSMFSWLLPGREKKRRCDTMFNERRVLRENGLLYDEDYFTSDEFE